MKQLSQGNSPTAPPGPIADPLPLSDAASATHGGFTVRLTSRCGSNAAGDSPRTPLNGSASLDAERRQWLERQKEEARSRRRMKLQAFVAEHEDALVSAVPIEVRLRTLLAEGRRHELERAAKLAEDPKMSSERRRAINEAYGNLIEDVRKRCAVIAQHAPQPQHLHVLGSEAISCFSSMLPWSQGVVAVDHVRVPSPTSSSSTPSSASPSPATPSSGPFHPTAVADIPPTPMPKPRARATPGMLARRTTAAAACDGAATATHCVKQRAASVPPVIAAAAARSADEEPAAPVAAAAEAAEQPTRSMTPTPSLRRRWSFPQRLQVDSRKVAAINEARQQRLAALAKESSTSAADAAATVEMRQAAVPCRSPPGSMPA